MVRSGNLALLQRHFPTAAPVRIRIIPSSIAESRDWISRNRIIYWTMATVLGRVIVYGGKGALGSACVSQFKTQNWVSGKIHECHYSRINLGLIASLSYRQISSPHIAFVNFMFDILLIIFFTKIKMYIIKYNQCQIIK